MEPLKRGLRWVAAVAAVLVTSIGPIPPVRAAGGDKIAFVSDRGGPPNIWVIDVNTLDETRNTESVATDVDPDWSPDGLLIAFGSLGGGIRSVRTDGSTLLPITSCPTDASPSWSPDGDRVVFTRQRGKVLSIYRVHSDGTSPRVLHASPGAGPDVDWSADGTRIAFVENAGVTPDGLGLPQIFTMTPDGTDQLQITEGGSQNLEPAWSPDGTRIAFASDRGGNFDVQVMKADGTGVTNLTNHPAEDREPTWSPDGNRIAFSSDRDGNDEIYVMNADGSGAMRLTTNPASDHSPDWQPILSSNRPGSLDPSPVPCEETHSRSISLRLGGSLVARGRIDLSEGSPENCAAGPVRVERKQADGWTTVGRGRSGAKGQYRIGIEKGSGTYRARAVRFGFPGPPGDPVRQICLRDVSPVRRHAG